MPLNDTCVSLVASFVTATCDSYIVRMRGEECSFVDQFTPTGSAVYNTESSSDWKTYASYAGNLLQAGVILAISYAYWRTQQSQTSKISASNKKETKPDGTVTEHFTVDASMTAVTETEGQKLTMGIGKPKVEKTPGSGSRPDESKEEGVISPSFGGPITPAVRTTAVKQMVKLAREGVTSPTLEGKQAAVVNLAALVDNPGYVGTSTLMQGAARKLSVVDAGHGRGVLHKPPQEADTGAGALLHRDGDDGNALRIAAPLGAATHATGVDMATVVLAAIGENMHKPGGGGVLSPAAGDPSRVVPTPANGVTAAAVNVALSPQLPGDGHIVATSTQAPPHHAVGVEEEEDDHHTGTGEHHDATGGDGTTHHEVAVTVMGSDGQGQVTDAATGSA